MTKSAPLRWGEIQIGENSQNMADDGKTENGYNIIFRLIFENNDFSSKPFFKEDKSLICECSCVSVFLARKYILAENSDF